MRICVHYQVHSNCSTKYLIHGSTRGGNDLLTLKRVPHARKASAEQSLNLTEGLCNELPSDLVNENMRSFRPKLSRWKTFHKHTPSYRKIFPTVFRCWSIIKSRWSLVWTNFLRKYLTYRVFYFFISHFYSFFEAVCCCKECFEWFVILNDGLQAWI